MGRQRTRQRVRGLMIFCTVGLTLGTVSIALTSVFTTIHRWPPRCSSTGEQVGGTSYFDNMCI